MDKYVDVLKKSVGELELVKHVYPVKWQDGKGVVHRVTGKTYNLKFKGVGLGSYDSYKYARSIMNLVLVVIKELNPISIQVAHRGSLLVEFVDTEGVTIKQTIKIN
jgi:hypothetical protein